MLIQNRLPSSIKPLVLLLACWMAHSRSESEPDFIEPITNVSVAIGRDAVLSCSVNHLNEYKVGWVKADTKAIQAIDTTVVTYDSRISAEFSAAPAPLTGIWRLTIRNVRREDAGAYMCQINTDPMKSQVGYLDVMEPPNIDDDLTLSEQRIMEHRGEMRLGCTATGRPAPRIIWKREDGMDLLVGPCRNETTQRTRRHRLGTSGDQLFTVENFLCSTKVTRYHMATYLCIASNGVLPSVSKRINVIVMFTPTVRAENQMVGAPLGSSVRLECLTEASPMGIDLWYKDREMVVSGDRYSTEIHKLSSYTQRMTLTIEQFRHSDKGRYRCQAKNTFGQANATILLYEMPQWTRSSLVSISTTSQPLSTIASVDKPALQEISTLPRITAVTTHRVTVHNNIHPQLATLIPYEETVSTASVRTFPRLLLVIIFLTILALVSN